MSPNLQFSVDDAEHLQAVPRRTRRPFTTLRFLVDGLEVSARGGPATMLPWDDMATSNAVSPSPDSWSITCWMRRRGHLVRPEVPVGIAVQVRGSFITATEPVRAATSNPWRHLSAAFASTSTNTLLPVMIRGPWFDTGERELALVQALCAVLHDMPELRLRLDVPTRVRQLARDLDAASLWPHTPSPGLTRDAVDIDVAMRHLGYLHPYGRPLRADAVPPEAEAVDRVVAGLAANAYRAGRPIDRDQVQRIVREHFTGVEPWPFAGLVDD